MLDKNLFILFGILVFGIVSVAAFFLSKIKTGHHLEKALADAKDLLQKAKLEVTAFQAKAQEQMTRSMESFIEAEKRAAAQTIKIEKSISIQEDRLKMREEELARIAFAVAQQEECLSQIHTDLVNEKQKIVPTLSKVAGESVERVKEELLAVLDQDLELAHETRLSKVIDYTKENAPMLAKNLLIGAIQRFSAPTSVEKKSLIIPINRNETKARIIGQNVEVLAFLEDQLGVDIVFDDSKLGISVSHFELVKKHIARETILKLIKDRVINLDKVKQRLEEATAETHAHLRDIGERVVRKLLLEHRKFPPEFKEILGRLKYRTSYGQNILKHCFEVGYFTLLLGNELGLSQEICKIGGFFHDIGKAIDQEDGRPHDILTKEIMERFGLFSWEEIHAAWTHHDTIPIETAEALLVKAGDAISAGRPGARQETIEKYLARVMAIEGIANSYEGVNKTYAISGGRELRVMVDPKRLNDDNLPEMAKRIAEEIEANIAYPGQIKVNVIRRVQHNRTIKEKSKKTNS